MKATLPFTYFGGQQVRLGDKFRVSRWGDCVVTSFDELNSTINAKNTVTKETFNGLGQCILGGADLIFRSPRIVDRGQTLKCPCCNSDFEENLFLVSKGKP